MKKIEKILEELKDLTIKKDYINIQDVLKTYQSWKKGKLFEEYIAMLFEGNGYVASVTGGKNDGGADVVISTRNNPNKIIWVVQAKNHLLPVDKNTILTAYVKFEEVASKRYPGSSFMIISLSGYVDVVDFYNRTNMVLEEFEYLKGLIDNFSNNQNREMVIMPDLKPHNRWCYLEARELLKFSNRLTIPNATGTGKSYITTQFLFDYIDKKKLILAPNTEILEEIKKISPWSKNNSVFMTYSKLNSMNSRGRLEGLKFDLIVIDELHRAGALKWKAAIEYILINNPSTIVIGLSATPTRFLDGNRDMIDELTNGVHTTGISLTDAISREILPNPIYVTSLYNLNEEVNKNLKLLSESNLVDSDNIEMRKKLLKVKEDWDNSKSMVNLIKKYGPKNEKGLKFIVFCENKNHLKEMYSEVIGWISEAYGVSNRIKPYTIMSGQSGNKTELREFDMNEHKVIKILFCINKLNEGLHLNSISSVMLLRNSNSPNLILQQIGRAFDSNVKSFRPVIFDLVNNIENVEVVNFRNALKESGNKINKYRTSLGLKPKEIQVSIHEEYLNVINEFSNIERVLTRKWDDYFDSLIEFKEKNGHMDIPKAREYERLNQWCNIQRRLYAKSLLKDNHIEKLNSLEFCWNTQIIKWANKLNLLENTLNKCYAIEISYYAMIENYCIPVYTRNAMYHGQRYAIGKILEPNIDTWYKQQIKLYEGYAMNRERRLLFKNFLERCHNQSMLDSIKQCSTMDIWEFIKLRDSAIWNSRWGDIFSKLDGINCNFVVMWDFLNEIENKMNRDIETIGKTYSKNKYFFKQRYDCFLKTHFGSSNIYGDMVKWLFWSN